MCGFMFYMFISAEIICVYIQVYIYIYTHVNIAFHTSHMTHIYLEHVLWS